MKFSKALILILALFTLFSFVLSSFSLVSFAEDIVLTVTGIVEISKHGNIKLNVSHETVLSYFDFGDILTVSFGGVSVDLPLGTGFANVDSGMPVLVLQQDEDAETELAINMGTFASTYGIADKVTLEDGFRWDYREGFSDSTVFTLTMKEKAGYYEEFILRNLLYTDQRSDYPTLTDEQFANFREVRVGNIAEGVLYRSALPAPDKDRAVYALKAAKAVGITFFVDLADSEDDFAEASKTEGDYFTHVGHIAVNASVDITSPDSKTKFAAALRAMIAHPNGKYLVTCKEGKDRTGFVIGLLEALMGASFEEIVEDYMISFYNYYGVEKGTLSYSTIVNGGIRNQFCIAFGIDNPESADLKKEAEEYLAFAGFSTDEIAALRGVLSTTPETGVADLSLPVTVSLVCLALLAALLSYRKKRV